MLDRSALFRKQLKQVELAHSPNTFTMTNLALFDLDNTLLDGDSDYLWGQYLAKKGIVDEQFYETQNKKFYEDYQLGRLDIYAFLRLSLGPLAENSIADLQNWRDDFIATSILPIVSNAARQLVEKHRKAGDQLVIITATNRFVTSPIAEIFGVHGLLATEPQFDGIRYTGAVAGIPCFQKGKLDHLAAWTQAQSETFHQRWFYSDSYNDLPLLESVDHPHVVNPDPRLERTATDRNWPVLHLHAD